MIAKPTGIVALSFFARFTLDTARGSQRGIADGFECSTVRCGVKNPTIRQIFCCQILEFLFERLVTLVAFLCICNDIDASHLAAK